MTKLGFTMTSLVAAIPGAFLCYFLVMAFIDKFDKMITMVKVLSIGTLLVAALVTLMPIGVLLFFKSAPPTEDKETDKGGADAVVDEGDSVGVVEPFDDSEAELFDDDDLAEPFDDDLESDGSVAEADSEFDSAFDDESSAEFSVDDDESVAEADDDMFDDDDEIGFDDDFSFDDDDDE